MPHIEMDEVGGNDFDSPEELVAAMDKFIAKGFFVLVKWTCPKCKERVTSGVPNVYHSAGYYHDSPGCGFLYQGQRFGLAAIKGDPTKVPDLIRDSYKAMPEYDGPLPAFRPNPRDQ